MHVYVEIYVSMCICRQLLTELLGILRRTLTQEGEIRALLYNCLFDVFCEDKSLRPLVFDLLLPHFLKSGLCLGTSTSTIHICIHKDGIILRDTSEHMHAFFFFLDTSRRTRTCLCPSAARRWP